MSILKAARRPPPRRADPGQAAVHIEHLAKSYGRQAAVTDVSLSIGRGEIFGILGPNGAGKTTTVECAQGLRTPDSGTVRVCGLDPTADPQALRGKVGSQLQSSALPDRLKVWEALDLFASVTPGANNRWPGLLEQWGLAGQRDTSSAKLSGGQRQRLFVALAILGDPEVVFLDELTQGLDPAARQVAWSLVRQVRDRGTTVVLVTHYMDEAQQLCDRLALIHHGRVVATGSPQELIAASQDGIRVRFSTETADVSFLRSVPDVDQVVRRGRHVQVHGHGAVLAQVASSLVARGIVPADLRLEQPTLEDAYHHLTTPAPQGA